MQPKLQWGWPACTTLDLPHERVHTQASKVCKYAFPSKKMPGGTPPSRVLTRLRADGLGVCLFGSKRSKDLNFLLSVRASVPRVLVIAALSRRGQGSDLPPPVSPHHEGSNVGRFVLTIRTILYWSFLFVYLGRHQCLLSGLGFSIFHAPDPVHDVPLQDPGER